MAIVSRSSWGAADPKETPTRLSSVNRVFIHYTGMDADEQADHANCAARVRGIQRFHQQTRGWNDIAYSFIPCKHGFVFEGRGFGIRTAATGPCNDDSLAVCFLGDDSAGRDDVTNAGREAIVEIIDAIKHRYGRVSVHGHRDCMSTSCPGDELYSWLQKGLPLPEPTPRYRFELWVRDKLKAKSVWYRPGEGRGKRIFERFYGREDVREFVRQAQRRARFRSRKK